MGSTCSYLNEYSDASEIHGCIENIEGINSNSGSPSDTWIISLKNGTKYYNREIKKCFMKLFIDPLSFPENILSSDKLERLNALNYEIKVYKYIIRPLIDYKICPFFVRYLGSSKECSFNKLILMLRAGNVDLPKDRLIKSLYYMYTGKTNRPSITDINMIPLKKSNKCGIVNKIKYNFIINELIPNNTITFAEYIKINYTIDEEGEGNEFSDDFWIILFQISIACYAMSLSQLIHNDLHLGNIWITQLDTPITVVYKIGNICYSFNTIYKIMIYDFDLSYCPLFGINEYSNINVELIYNSDEKCNDLFKVRDIFKVINSLYIRTSEKVKLLSILSVNKNIMQMVCEDYEEWDENLDEYVKQNRIRYDNTIQSDEWMLNIINKIQSYSNTKIKIVQNPTIINYSCNLNMFDEYGRIILETYKNL